MELVLLYRGLWWGLSYCTEACDGACLIVQRIVVEIVCCRAEMELVLLYRGLWWGLSYCTQDCGGDCLLQG